MAGNLDLVFESLSASEMRGHFSKPGLQEWQHVTAYPLALFFFLCLTLLLHHL